MKKVLCLVAVMLLVGAAQATVVIGGAVGNGNLDNDGDGTAAYMLPDNDAAMTWKTNQNDVKHYIGADPSGAGYMPFWHLSLGKYNGGNNTGGLISYGNPLGSGTGDLSAFANSFGHAAGYDARDLTLKSVTYVGDILDGDQFSFSVNAVTNDTVANASVKAWLIFDEGLVSEYTEEFFLTGGGAVATGDVITNLAGTMDVFGDWSSISLKVSMFGASGKRGAMDDITLDTTGAALAPIPEPATMAILGLGALFLRRRK